MNADSKRRYRVRQAADRADVSAAQRLRYRAFRSGAARGSAGEGLDADAFDERCCHLMVEDAATGALVCCFRLLPLDSGTEIGSTYAGQYYELSSLAAFPGRMVEMGRFCIAPGRRDPEILRAAWRWIAAFVATGGIDLLFGCSSFPGTDGSAHRDAFALLCERHVAPRCWSPREKAPEVVRLAPCRAGPAPDPARALRAMPPLLRSYLAMGGWVSDHAVIDRELGTLHVFTGLEIRNIPAARVRRLTGAAALPG